MLDTSLIAALGLGFLLGLRHALEPDHVAAVSTFVSQERGLLRSCLRGTFWGVGHTAALLAAGIAVVAFKLQISPEAERSVDRVVALVLIVLGGHVLRRTFAGVSVHRHEHSHDGTAHSHVHLHVGGAAEHDHLHLLRGAPQPLLMGLLHGLAGSGALVVLVLTTMPTALSALLYILVFGVGSTLGMLALSGLIGVPFALTASRSAVLATVLQITVAVASMLIGVLMLTGRLG